jgi:TetR/AcrR family transcriptional regulator
MAFDKLEKEKQNKIINAACEVFARHGYRKASMKDIAETAGVSKSVLFKYFATKQNLYHTVFRLASDSILQADQAARVQGAAGGDMFSLMRRSAKTRLALFKEFPWLYKFSYAAAFDPDPFARALVQQEFESYRKARSGGPGEQAENADYRGLRQDVPLDAARQIIFWVSQGYLEENLHQDQIDPDGLEKGFARWIDVLELLLKDNSQR